jgi:SAM-dependent methyltransferase
MKSPLNNSSDVRLVRSFRSELIIKLYKENLGIDVSGFFQNIPEILLYECNESKYRFYYPFSIEGNSHFYEMLSTSSAAYYPGWKWENEVAKKYVKDGFRIIDVGCGDGSFLYQIKKEKQLECYGIEFNGDAIKKCIEKGITVYDKPVDIVAGEQPEIFDVATTFQVLEHISGVRSFLESKIKLVKKGGLVIIGVPYNNPYLYKFDRFHTLNLPPHHMGLWNEISLSNLTKYFPIAVENIYIEPLDDFAYYLFVQLRLTQVYNKLYRYKPFRFFSRSLNLVTKRLVKKIHGRNIVIILKKTE